MVGFTSLFRIPTSEAALPHLIGEAKVVEAPTVPDIDTLPDLDKSPIVYIPDTLPVIDTVPDLEELIPTSSGPPTPNFHHPKQLSGFGNKKIYRCVLAQDGHSHGEEALYQVLWKAGKSESDDTRTISIGYGEMSKRIRLSFNNTKSTCQRLIQKLALEEIAQELSHQRIGKTYRVFSYRAILERRRSKGMEWVIKSKGVEFVLPIEFTSQSIAGTLPVTDISGTLPAKDTVSITGRDSLSISGRGSMSITGPLLDNSFREVSRELLTSSSTVVATALSEYGVIDDDAVQIILTECRRHAPDATPEEIAYFIRQKGRVVANGKIDNPIGFLIVYVPKCFIGESLQIYRDQERRRREAAEQETAEANAWVAEHRRQQEEILDNPDASEEDKQWARRLLTGEGN